MQVHHFFSLVARALGPSNRLEHSLLMPNFFLHHWQGDQIGRNFAIWAIFYGVGQIFFLEIVAQ